MALPSSGRISMNDIHIALGGQTITQCSLNDSDFRSLAGIPNGKIQMSDFHGAALAREIPSYFYSSSAITDPAVTVYNREYTRVNPQSNKKNLLILIDHVDIWWHYWGTIYVDFQDGETGPLLDMEVNTVILGQSLGYWREMEQLYKCWWLKYTVANTNPGDYTRDERLLAGSVIVQICETATIQCGQGLVIGG